MTKPVIDFLVEYDDESLLDELRRVAAVTGSGTVSKADLKKFGRVNPSTINRHFGTLHHALIRAGLKGGRFMKAADEELLAIIVSLWQQVLQKEGRTPHKNDLRAYGFAVSPDTITRRFGGMAKSSDAGA